MSMQDESARIKELIDVLVGLTEAVKNISERVNDHLTELDRLIAIEEDTWRPSE
jgi:phosphate uptake regulator